MSLWFSHPLFLPSLIIAITIVLWATLAVAGVYDRAAVFGGDDRQNCAAGSDLWRVCLVSILAFPAASFSGIAIRKTAAGGPCGTGAIGATDGLWPLMVGASSSAMRWPS